MLNGRCEIAPDFKIMTTDRPSYEDPGSTLKITGVVHNGNNRYIHASVFAPASRLSEFQSLLNLNTSWLIGMLDYDLRDPRMREFGARAAFIYRKSKANIRALHTLLAKGKDRLLPDLFPDEQVDLPAYSLPGDLSDETRKSLRKLLAKMFYCTPNQGVGNNIEENTRAVVGKNGAKAALRSNQRSCDQYRLCPWCRYREALRIFNALEARRYKYCEFGVTHFLNPCNSEQLDVNRNQRAYEALVRAWDEKADREGDYFITLPRRVQTSRWQDGEPDRYNLVWRTSIIALFPQKQLELLGPDSVIPKKTNSTFMSDGIWHLYPTTKKGLGEAFKTIMDYPIDMLVLKHDAGFVLDVLTVLAAGDRDRAAGHGLEDFRKPSERKSTGDADPHSVQTETPVSSFPEVASGEPKQPD